MGRAIRMVKSLTWLLLAPSLSACSAVPVLSSNHAAGLYDRVSESIQNSALGDDMKRGCNVSLQDQFRDQIQPVYESDAQHFGAVLFLGAEYVSMSSMVLKGGDHLELIYRDMDGRKAVRDAEQSKLHKIYALIASAASSAPVVGPRGAELHEPCVVFISSVSGDEVVSVMPASAAENPSTTAGRASALLQGLVE